MSARAVQDPFNDYRAAEGVNKSWLDEMNTSALHFETAPSRESEPTKAMLIGRRVHTSVLEPDLYNATTAVWTGGFTQKGVPTMDKGCTDYKVMVKDQAAIGCEVIDAEEDWLYRRIRRAVLEHREAREMLNDSEHEVSIYWEHPIGLACKSRLDGINRKSFIFDLKTAADITPVEFGKAAHRLSYHSQGAMYQDAAKALTGQVLPYYIIAVEKCEPFDVAVYELGNDLLAMGRSKYCDNLRKVKECRASGIWPGVAPEVVSLEFPQWAYTDEDDVLDFTGMEVSA